MPKSPLQRLLVIALFVWAVVLPTTLRAQDATPQTETPAGEDEQQAPAQVNVEPTAADEEIEVRLTSILEATGWFVDPVVDVRDGVGFLDGQSFTEEQREWAGNLARNTQDVVAVVNRIEVIPRPIWDLTPALQELRAMWRSTVLAIPLIVFGIVVIVVSWWLMGVIAHFFRTFFIKRVGSPLLAFWYDATQYAPIKVKSSLLRLIKRAIQDAGISMPDESREMIFPQGVPIVDAGEAKPTKRHPVQVTAPRRRPPQEVAETEPLTSAAEGDLRNGEQEIRAQAESGRSPEGGEDLLEDA